MRIQVRARPNSAEEKVEKIDNENFVISVKEPPREGKANLAILRAVSNYFGVPMSRVAIVSGQTSKNKIIEVL